MEHVTDTSRSKLEHIDRDALARVLKEILTSLNAAGVTYETIAKDCGLEDGARIRNFLIKSADRRGYRSTNKVLAGLVDYANSHEHLLANHVPSRVLSAYLAVVTGDVPGSIAYKKVDEQYVEGDLQSCGDISDILHNFLRFDPAETRDKLRNFIGNYYCYRGSVDPHQIIKALLIIERNGFSSDAFCFRHYHPHSNYDGIPEHARFSFGPIIHRESKLFMIGGVANGRGVTYLAVQEPFDEVFRRMNGFCLTVNSTGIVVARVVLVKDSQASVDGIRRMNSGQFRDECPDYDISLLKHRKEDFGEAMAVPVG